jgi:hypothetical protein
MESIKFNSNLKINPNVKIIFLPAFTIFILILLIFPVFNYGYQQITTQYKTLDEKAQQIGRLEAKLDVLREVKDSVLENADTSLLAVPSVNPTLWKLYQIYKIAEEDNVTLSSRNAKAESGKSGNLLATEINFIASGNFDALIKFFEDINNNVPLSTLETINIKRDKGGFGADVSFRVYRASLPTELPALTQPIKNFTEDQQALLEKLAEMKPPDFTTVPPSDPSQRENPFR